MKVFSGGQHEYNEEFKFCPECGQPFGGEAKKELERRMNQHLFDMKHQAGHEANLSRRVFSGSGLGDRVLGGKVYGSQTPNTDL